METPQREERLNWNSFARKQAHERWRKQSAAMGSELTKLVVREAAVEPGMQVLDVACGSGEPAISIADQLAGTGTVIGTDISEEPLEVARERAQQRGLTNVNFELADVHNLPFEDASYDRVTCRLGLMYFADLPRALGEIRRVLRPGGRFTAATWGPMEQTYFSLTIGTIRRILPQLKLPESSQLIFKFGDPARLQAQLAAAGFSQIHAELRSVAWDWLGTPEEVWQYFQAVTVPFTPLIQAIPTDRKPEIDREVEAAFQRLYDGEAVRIQAKFTLATAEKELANSFRREHSRAPGNTPHLRA